MEQRSKMAEDNDTILPWREGSVRHSHSPAWCLSSWRAGQDVCDATWCLRFLCNTRRSFSPAGNAATGHWCMA